MFFIILLFSTLLAVAFAAVCGALLQFPICSFPNWFDPRCTDPDTLGNYGNSVPFGFKLIYRVALLVIILIAYLLLQS